MGNDVDNDREAIIAEHIETIIAADAIRAMEAVFLLRHRKHGRT